MENQVLLSKDFLNAIYVVIGVLWFLTISGFGFILTMFWSKVKYHDERLNKHGLDIQHLKDVQGVKIDDLKTEFKEFKNEIKNEMHMLTEKISTLSDNVHKQKNTETNLDIVLKQLLKQLEKNEDKQHP